MTESDTSDMDDDQEGGDIPEDHIYFEGPCTCEHDPEEHGWGSCDVEGCPCEAGWTE